MPIGSYGETYVAGASEQKANMAALSKNIAAVDALLKSANDIAQEASTLFPQLDLDGYDWITDSEKELVRVSAVERWI